MRVDERAFRRLLAWYPRKWRQANADILLSTLLDAAECDGRATPTSSERFAAALNGTAVRLDGRFAICTSVAAVVCGIVGTGLLFTLSTLSGWPATALTAGLAAWFTALAAIAILRDRGVLSDGRAIALVIVSPVPLALNALAAISWSLGFDQADAGAPQTGLAAIWLPLAVTAWLSGAAAIALVVQAVFAWTTMGALTRVALAGLCGILLAPPVGLSLSLPFGSAVVAFGVFILALVPRGAVSMRRPAAARAQTGVPPAASPASSRSAVRLLSAVAAGGGALGVGYAFTGAQWSLGATDTTVAMGQGLTILLISAIPLLAALGILMTSPAVSGRPRDRWGPLTLVVVSLGFFVAWYAAPAAQQDSMTLVCFIGFALTAGSGLAWWVLSILRTPGFVVVFGLFAGSILVALACAAMVPMAVFVVPIIGLIIALRPGRMTRVTSRRRRASGAAAHRPASGPIDPPDAGLSMPPG